MATKVCITCGIEKDENLFVKNRSQCKDCKKKYLKQYQIENKQKLKEKQIIYYNENKEKKREYQKQYRIKNKDYMKQYRAQNKDKIRKQRKRYNIDNKDKIVQYRIENKDIIVEKRRKYENNKRNKDFVFKFRKQISSVIWRMLKSNNLSKNGKSYINCLPYTIQELKDHLESKFEDWMTWDNYGKYNAKTWDDTDPATWTWNMDHIISQASLPYTSTEDENFKKCWALSNLRPYSAKRNIIDGNRRKK